MSVLAQIFIDTVRIGGSVLFIREKAPADLSDRIMALAQDCENLIPFAVRSLQNFEQDRFTTSSRDLLVLFEEQKSFLPLLGTQVQGQRLLFTTAAIDERYEDLLDFGSSEMTLDEWKKALIEASKELKHLPPQKSLEMTFDRPCLFLDRDDVVVKNVSYNIDPEKVELLPGIAKLINDAHAKQYWVALVTNQSGLGRGWINWHQYQDVHHRMLQLLAAEGAWIDDMVWSPYISSSPTDEGRLFASLRKPRAGMLQRVTEKLKPSLSASVMIGDSATDLIAAHSLGVKKLYLLTSEKVEKEEKTLKNFMSLEGTFRYDILTDFKNVIL